MNTMGLTFMLLAWGIITGLVVWCFRKIFSTGSSYDK